MSVCVGGGGGCCCWLVNLLVGRLVSSEVFEDLVVSWWSRRTIDLSVREQMLATTTIPSP